MRGFAFLIGFILVFTGASINPESPIWMAFPLIVPGIALMWWGSLVKVGNRYRR